MGFSPKYTEIPGGSGKYCMICIHATFYGDYLYF